MKMELRFLITCCLVSVLVCFVTSQSRNYRWRSYNPHLLLGGRRTYQRGGRGGRTRRMGTTLSGPNVCHEKGSIFCCPGWAVSKNGRSCLTPKCEEGACGPNGLCRKPNLCLCSNGQIMSSCPPEPTGVQCNIRCMHGGECVDNQCRCPYGYTGPHCGQPICGPGCLNGGRCIAPGRCACIYGFTGMRCERDYRKGPCFMTRTNSTCINQVPGVMCTKLFCCATVGEGWGHPCEECPARVGNCSKGRLPPHCADINECEIMPGLCERGSCVNTDGSFFCECPEGFRYDRTTHQCVDINECDSSAVCNGGECINTEGSFVCECPPDTKLSNDGSYCVSDVPGRCYTAIESGMCASPLPNLVRRTMCCCVQSGRETLGKCFAAIGQFAERCATIGTPEYDRDCGGFEDPSNLCGILGATACAHGRCVDQPEIRDYYCECDEGYQVTADNKRCVDTNECSPELNRDGDICGKYGTCLNSDGSFRCHCTRGFENSPGSLTECIDINECDADEDENRCENGACVNTKGSYICNCDTGYRSSATRQDCNDINECEETEGLCENGRCVNIDGNYKCICDIGFTTSPDFKQCLDNDECERDNMCANGICVNMEGMYKCECNPGFKLLPNGRGCADINECEMNPCVNGRCENSLGSFECLCHRFQVLDSTGTRCILDRTLSQCYRSIRNGQCRPHNALALAVTRADCCCSVPGSTSAWNEDCEICPEVGDADHAVLCTTYVVSNMCELMENACENGHCIKMGSSRYRCSCNPGFLVSEDQMSCIDFDECSQSLCSNGECRNTPGSYTCTCNDGYLLNGDVCEDVDECLSNPCTNARCVNEPGRYRCVCEEGTQIDVSGHVCHDVRVGRCWLHYSEDGCMGTIGNRLLSVEECCNSIGHAWGSVDCRPCEDFDLKCKRGYFFDIQSNQCVNIKECEFGVCEDEAQCVDTIGSFRCVCPPGFTLDADGRTCVDLRIGTCYVSLDESGDCSVGVSVGAFMMSRSNCCCSQGKAWGDNCEHCPAAGTQARTDLCSAKGLSFNECIMFPDMCENGLCTNTDNSFACRCNRGFTLDEDGRSCSDINECQISPGICGSGQCVNVDGDFRCDCEEGYVSSAATKICIDRDECTEGGFCTGGTCYNTEGSYQCVCPDGRSLSEDGSRCVDVDECALRPDLCAPNGRCENMLGYYMCICDAGYVATSDAQDCIDMDECATNNGGCHMGCTNTIGSYECSCDEGFVLTFDGHTCADRDECMEQMNRCDGGRCENTVGAFRCICFDGFMSTNDLQFCEDIDECAMNPNVCMDGRCHNTRGSYTCNCNPGFCVPQGQMICVDEDECEMSKHNCHVNADCNNTEGGYECSCINGFNGDGYMCHDDDECALETHNCHNFAICRNTLGSYACDCAEGYHGDGYSCSDNDDCLEDETLCGPHGQCLNVDGSFECYCPMGFATTADRKACKDIDECAFEEICVNGRCHNVPGTFSCACLVGYEKDEQGANCTDIDECQFEGNCLSGECINTEGTYECQCPEGFELNPTGIGCVDNRIGSCFLHSEGDENAAICSDPIGVGVTKATCCCSHVAGWGDPCELCPEVNSTEYKNLCPGGVGFMPNPITVLLEDIDECRNLPGLCQGGKCINVFGSYICECPIGYQLEEETRTCDDVNECEEDEVGDICGAGECRNTVGGYNCACPVGFKSIQGGRKCEDIRVEACYRNYNESSGECSNEVFEETRKTCCCYDNVGSGWNTPCEVCPQPGSDEFFDLCASASYIGADAVCEDIEQLCENGLCVPDGETFRCECPMGYHYNDDTLICEDDDECVEEDLCFADAECINQPGSYRCACREGFSFDVATETCIDIDECDLGNACVNGDCYNSRGGFTCDCNQGFRAVNDEKACEDVDECERDPCGRGICQNVFGSFTCTCDAGFRISDNGDCVDTNECEEEGQCGQGECVNFPGDFACDCAGGYQATPDRRNCIDTNECLVDTLVCGVGTCQNMDGSFKCYCPDGYSSVDDKSCNDTDECASGEYCKFGECENTDGSFICHCPEDHVLSKNKKHCVDTRQAKCFFEIANDTCSLPGQLDVTFGTCCCQCRNGGWGVQEEGCMACPLQETTEFDDLCPFGCGYTPQGIDINECRDNPCTNGRCMNIAASFRCICSTGFTLDASGVRCVDVNECENAGVCGRGTCENTEGSFECECEIGFYNGPSITCLDIDECREDLGLNHCGFRCENTEGSFHCACPQGFQLRKDGRMCEDIDECTSDALNDCTAKGMSCKNVVGYYTCLCPSGYRRIGTADACVDINECDQVRVCTNGVCVNSEGSYGCQCSEGYDYDEENKMCLDTRQGVCYAAVHQRMCEVTSTTGLPFTKAECCCNRGKGWGDECEECPHPGTEAFLILCPHGMGFQPNGDDIDDCKVLPGLCEHGTCINMLGTFRCACDHGYEPTTTNKACTDYNECLATPSPCSFDCRNTEGSFECVCPKGFQTDQSRSACVDLDECATKRHNCQYLCLNTVGSFKCECPHGFTREDAQCVDRNECIESPGICGARGLCRNDPGGYHCECPRGYRRGMGQACIDVDECSSGQGSCGGNCQNVAGSYRCLCGRGYLPSRYGRGCQDVDECINSPCGLGQSCTNKRGGFDCGCSRGLAAMGGGCGDVDECSLGGGSCSFGCQNSFGSFSCSCPGGFFRLGASQCGRGSSGFQQRIPRYPMFPSFGNQGMPPMGMPPMGMPPQQDTVCYNCMPGGDVRRRQRRMRRSADEPEGRFIEINDRHGKATLNTSYPIEIFVTNEGLTHKTPLLEIRTSLKQLREHSRYQIVSGNDDRRFRLHHQEQVTVLHFAKKEIDRENSVVVEPAKYNLHLRASTTLEQEELTRASFESETILEALEDQVEMDLQIIVEEL